MSDRSAHLPLVVLLLALAANFLVFMWLGPSSLGPPPHGTVAAELGGWTLILFAAYEAFTIQRALPVRLFKNQARGILLVALAVLLLGVSQGIITPYTLNGSRAFGTPINYPFIYFTWLVLFYWFDASIRAARRSDPLLRDTLRWSQVRIVIWTLMVGSMLVAFSFVLYAVFATGLSIFAQANLPSVGEPDILGFLSLVLPIIAGGIYVPIAAFRSRDPTLRRHLVWFGYFVLLFVALLLAFPLAFLLPQLAVVISFVQSEMLLVASYFVYRSARSLAPLNRISLD